MRLVRSGLVLLVTRPLLAQRGHAYWDANPDSLRQVLAGHMTGAKEQWLQYLKQTVAPPQELSPCS